MIMRLIWVAILLILLNLLFVRISHLEIASSGLNDRVERLEDGRAFSGDWAQEHLRDNAPEGCPGQYHQYTTGPDGAQWLTGCWGLSSSPHDPP
jgi:hypothetical protein